MEHANKYIKTHTHTHTKDVLLVLDSSFEIN
jgi:hypothetical protein